eukprot:gene24111-25791_t
MADMLMGKDLNSFYGSQRMAPSGNHVALRDPRLHRLPDKVDRYTYQMLVESKSIANLIRYVLVGDSSFSGLLAEMAELSRLSSATNIEHVLQWVITIDNSGSMSIYEKFLFEALVVVLEVMKKAEADVAVAKIGSVEHEKIIKEFGTSIDAKGGQFILDNITLNEGSKLASGTQAVCNSIWGSSYRRGDNAPKKDANGRMIQKHHLMILITDAHSEEVFEGASAFRNLKDNFDIIMSLLVISSDSDAAFLQTCKTIATSEQLLIMLDPRIADTMQTAIGKLLLNMFNAMHSILAKANNAAAGHSAGTIVAPAISTISLILPLLPFDSIRPIGEDAKRSINLETSLKGGAALPDVLYRVSARNSTLPSELVADAPNEDSLAEDRRASLLDAQNRLVKYFAAHAHPNQGQKVAEAAKYWENAAILLAPDIASLANAFEDDTESAVAASLVMITTALTTIGLEHFSLMTFGDRVRVLKTSEQPWDQAAQ